MGTQDRAVPGEVVKVVHDDGHEQVEHEEAAEEDEGDKEEVGDVAAAGLAGLQQFPRGAVLLDGSGVTFLSGTAGQHDVGPGLTSRTSGQKGRFYNTGAGGGFGGGAGGGGVGGDRARDSCKK